MSNETKSRINLLRHNERRGGPSTLLAQAFTPNAEVASADFQAHGTHAPQSSGSERYLELGADLVSHRDYWDALPYLEKVRIANLQPNLRTKALLLVARALVGTGRLSLARQKLARAVAMDPSSVDAFIGLSWAEFLSDDLKSASRTVEIGENKWPDDSSLHLIGSLIAREKLRGRLSLPFGQEWHLKGVGISCCPCNTPCPCRSNGRPSHGHCETVSACRIDHGHYGKVSLDGLTLCMMEYSCQLSGPPLVLFVDRTATDEQVIALEEIFQSFDTLQPSTFLRVKRASIRFVNSPQDHIYDIEIPGRIHLKIQRELDGSGKPLMQTAALDRWSNTIEYAKNLIYRVWGDEPGRVKQDYSGRQATYRTIDLNSTRYRDGMMLVQFRDDSGFFNARQLKIIHALKLPMLRNYPRSSQAKP